MLRYTVSLSVAALLVLATAHSTAHAEYPPPEPASAEYPPPEPANMVRAHGKQTSSVLVPVGAVLIVLGHASAITGGLVAVNSTGIGFGGGSGSEAEEVTGYVLALGGAAMVTTGIVLAIIGAVRNAAGDDDEPAFTPGVAVLDDRAGLVLGATGRF